MKTWKILRIYKLQAESKTEALGIFGTAVHNGTDDELLEMVIVKEDEPKGFFNTVKKQLAG